MHKGLTLALAGLLLLGLTACGGAPAPSSSPEYLVGAYSEERALTAEDRAVFDAATADLAGVEYEPENVATQVVNGTNYRFFAKGMTVTDEPEETIAYIYIHQPLDPNEPPTLTRVEEVG